ncbi:alpha/beta fold hydrolase [Nakamurella silvestris]|nr:alpha/beta fold hydrolase [Nakamurella silvestris]
MTEITVDQDQAVIAGGWLGEPRPGAAHLVLLHGFSCDETEMLDDALKLAPHLDGLSCRLSSVRGWSPAKGRSSGYEWVGPGPGIGYPAPDLASSVARLIEVVEALHDGPVVLMGFSQGAAMSSEVLRHRPDLVAGLVALSGYTLIPPRPADEELRRDLAAGVGVPTFLAYDEQDHVICGKALTWTAEYYRNHTALTERTYEGLGHRISSRQMADIAAFLAPLLAGD